MAVVVRSAMVFQHRESGSKDGLGVKIVIVVERMALVVSAS